MLAHARSDRLGYDFEDQLLQHGFFAGLDLEKSMFRGPGPFSAALQQQLQEQQEQQQQQMVVTQPSSHQDVTTSNASAAGGGGGRLSRHGIAAKSTHLTSNKLTSTLFTSPHPDHYTDSTSLSLLMLSLRILTQRNPTLLNLFPLTLISLYLTLP